MTLDALQDLPEPKGEGQEGLTSILTSNSDRRQKVHVYGSFLRSSTEMQLMARGHMGKLRGFMKSYYLANFMALIVLVDAYCTCANIDARAQGRQTPPIYSYISDVCLMLYSLEIVGLILLFGFSVLKDWMIGLDVIIVACGWVEVVIEYLGNSLGFRIAVLRALRLMRIFRLMRLLKRIRPLKELHKLLGLGVSK